GRALRALRELAAAVAVRAFVDVEAADVAVAREVRRTGTALARPLGIRAGGQRTAAAVVHTALVDVHTSLVGRAGEPRLAAIARGGNRGRRCLRRGGRLRTEDVVERQHH